MAEGIVVRIVPGCPSRVIAETEGDRELVEAALASVECGCSVEVEAPEAALPGEEVEAAKEVEEPTSELAEETELEQAEEAPKCSLEPYKPWDESVCGVVARQAADDVLRRLRERGVVE